MYKLKKNHWDAENYIICFLSEALRAGSITSKELPKIKEILLKMAEAGNIVQGSRLSEEIRKIQIAFNTNSEESEEPHVQSIEESVVVEPDKKNLVIPREVVQNPLASTSHLKLNVTDN